MEIVRAEVMGMCFGVRDALAILQGIESPEVVTIHGELVHNERVLNHLHDRGFRQESEISRHQVPSSPVVLITAHGISDVERSRLEAAGKTLIDTTCPLVTRVHDAARDLREKGYHVLVIGKPGHVEVRGIVEDLDRFDVIQSPEEVRTYAADRLGIVCQTTATSQKVKAVREAIEARNSHAEIKFVDTVCRPTKDHQNALDRMLERVEAVVVVGGKNSNNTRELAATCRSRGVPTLLVQGAEDLDPSWFAGFQVVGLTAGTSTLDATIDEVERALLEIDARCAETAPACGPLIGGNASALDSKIRVAPIPLHSSYERLEK